MKIATFQKRAGIAVEVCPLSRPGVLADLSSKRWLLLLAAAAWSVSSVAAATNVTFDLPEAIECRDVTTREFAASHPSFKVIEAKLQISARITQGTEQEILNFRYFISSPDKLLTFREYSPNTRLESTVADDQIEVSEGIEKSEANSADAHVSQHVLSLGGSKNQTNKNTKTSKYKQLAAKSLVVASGTTDREHGLFFTLKPSRDGTLEGAKEFMFRAVVPRNWRGDWCTISCTARAEKKSVFSTSDVPAGTSQSDVGLYLATDEEAAMLARNLRRAQDRYASAMAAQNCEHCDPVERVFAGVSREYKTVLSVFRSKSSVSGDSAEANPLEQAQEAMWDFKERLRGLAN